MTDHPDTSRSDRITTPASQATTTQGSAGSSAARTREAIGQVEASGAAGVSAGPTAGGVAAVAPPGSMTPGVPASVGVARRCTAVATGTASIKINVVSARA